MTGTATNSRAGRVGRPARSLLALLSFSMLLVARAAEASNGSAPIAIGGRAAGRGGADTALADDPLSLHHQPAGIAQLGRLRLDLQDMFVIARDRFVNARNDSQDTGFSYFAPTLGVAIDPRWGEAAATSVRLGFIAGGTNGTSGDKRYTTAVYPEGVVEELDYTLIKAGPVIAVSPFPELRLGFGLFYNNLAFSTKSASTGASNNANGTLRKHRNPDGTIVSPPEPFLIDGRAVTWDELFAIGSSADSNAAALFELDESTAHGLSFNLGIQFDPAPWVTLGFSYVSPSFFFGNLEGDAKIDASKALAAIQSDPDIQALVGPVLDAYLPDGAAASFLSDYDYEIEAQWAPQIVSLGAAFFPHPAVVVAADFKWMNYSTCYNLKATLRNGTNRNINELNGTDQIRTKVELNWSDIFVFGLGVSVTPPDADWLTLRAGYNYANNPYPEDEITPGTTAFVEHHVTLGASFVFGDGFSGTVAAVYALPREIDVTIHKDNSEFNDSRFGADQAFVYLGLSYEY